MAGNIVRKLRMFQWMGLLLALILVAIGHGICYTDRDDKDPRIRQYRQCTSIRLPIELWDETRKSQYGVCFVTAIMLVIAFWKWRGTTEEKDDVYWCLPFAAIILCALFTCMEVWNSLIKFDPFEHRILGTFMSSLGDISRDIRGNQPYHQPGSSSASQPNAYVETWLAAAFIYFIVAILYIFELCIDNGHCEGVGLKGRPPRKIEYSDHIGGGVAMADPSDKSTPAGPKTTETSTKEDAKNLQISTQAGPTGSQQSIGADLKSNSDKSKRDNSKVEKVKDAKKKAPTTSFDVKMKGVEIV